MLPWKMVIVALLYCCIKPGAARSRTKALFPAASRMKRGVAAMANPTFLSSINDAHLLFEILMTGIHFESNGTFSVRDAELASLQKTRNLDLICEDIIPKKLTDILRLISSLSHHTGYLHQDDFERVMMTLVYTAHQMATSITEYQRDVWAESFVSLYKTIKKDLTLRN
ncbi:protein FAM180A-like [Archocentrus centrarchus]|uniref:protein FAM180A-like n=1 Tax=Archocentrus centrarchus TaxID=63155 RepID=UPI0011EA1C1D|nr:protein FAM180A-like [Archocentrus centrarchus]